MSSLAPQSTLTYLRDELGLTVERIQLALASYSERPEEKSELELAGRYLRQLRGVLTMMERPTGTRFAHEMVRLLDLIANGEAKDFEAARDAVLMAALKLEPFIAGLERGDRDGVGVDLAGTVDQLRVLRGKSPLNTPTRSAAKADAADLDRLLVRKLRPAYQSALAHVVRGQDVEASLGRLQQVLEQVRDMAQTETPYRLWWSGSKLLRALREGWLEPGPEVISLLGQIDRKLREQVDLGKAAFGGEQALGLLAKIEAKVRESAEGAALFDDRSDYRPPAQSDLTPPAAPATDMETLRQIAANMVDDISVAQDLVDRMAAGEEQPQDAATDLGARLKTVAGVLAMVNLHSSASLLARQSQRLSQERPLDAAEVERLAADLVLVEDSLAGLVDPAVTLLEKEAQGNESGLSPVKNRQARKAVAKQALEHMVRLHELSLDLSWNRADDLTWKDLSPTVHRVANVFAMLGDERAHQLAERLRKVLEHQRTEGKAQGENEFMAALAEVMVALELHLRAEEGSELWNLQNLERAEKCLDKLQDLLTEEAAIAESLAESFDRENAEGDAKTAGDEFNEYDSRRLGQTVALSDPKQFKAFVDSIEGDGADGETSADSEQLQIGDEIQPGAGEPAAAEVAAPSGPEPQLEPQPQPGSQPGSESEPALRLEQGPEPEAVADPEPLTLPQPLPGTESLFEPQPEPLPDLQSLDEPLELPAAGGPESDLDETLNAAELEPLALPEIESRRADVADTLDCKPDGDGDDEVVASVASDDLDPAVEVAGAAATVTASAVASEDAAGSAPIQTDSAASEGATAAPAGSDAAWQDHEFLEIFLEEAEGELEALRAAVPNWIADSEDFETLGAIRRSFHTLKGSGRMVGVETVGEFAWALENLLNRVLERALPVPASLGAVLQQALETLGRFVERMKQGDDNVDVAPILAAVATLQAGAEHVVPELESEPDASAGAGPESAAVDRSEAESEHASEADGADLAEAAAAGAEAPDEAGAVESPAEPADAAAVEDRDETPDLEGAAARPGAAQEACEAPADADPGGAAASEPPPMESAQSDRDSEPLNEFDPELADIFAQEASDILEAGDQILARWADGDEDAGLLIELRRGMHTLKGSSRMAGFVVIGDLAHAVESLLDDMSKGVMRLNPAIVAVLQQAVDRFHGMTATARGLKQPEPASDLVAALNNRSALAAQPEPETETEAPAASSTESSAASAEPVSAPAAKVSAPEPVATVADASEMVRVHADLLDRLADQTGETNIFRARIAQGVSNFDSQLKEMDQTIGRLSEKLRRLEIETEAQILFRYERGDNDDFEEFDPLELDRFSELQQLSRSLMEVVNDLTSIRNSLEEQNREMDSLLHQQEKVNRDIQDQLTRTRMVKFEGTLPRMRRVVRQAASDLGKRAELSMVGGGEMERGLLEHVLAPLEHILRNAVAHGLEDPETRRRVGKAESGQIVISMAREGSELVVSVSDDGAGINFEAVRNKAEQAGLVAPGASASREELLDCLMAPGFSTADRLTQVSGRGVGMDVVADSVRGLGGSLSIESEDGKGARFVMRMPFSLSLTHTLLVRAGGAVYAVPLAGIEAMARISPDDLKDYVDSGAAQVIYDDETYDLHSLGALLEGSAPRGDNLERWLPAMLVKSDTIKVALQVDAVIGSQETMVKPVGPLVNSVPGLSGATILPDGRVVLILEMAALVRSLVRRQAKTEAVALERAQRTGESDALQVMVIDDSITMRKVTSKLLQRHGIKVHLAKDGLDAAGQLEDLVPDAIVLDIEMPRMDGFELAAHVRNRDHLRDLPIIMVTSRTGEKHRQRAARLNVQEYLGKPYREEELLAALRRILGPRAENLVASNG